MTQPGWYRDPGGASTLRFWDGQVWTDHRSPYPPPAAYPAPMAPMAPFGARTPALDLAVEQMDVTDPTPWGWRPVVVPIATLVVLIVAGGIVSSFVHPRTFDGKIVATIVANAIAETLLALALWQSGRRVAARYGGWGRAFGWRRPKLIDLAWVGGGFVAALILRIIVGVVANGLSHGRAAKQAQNFQLDHVSFAAVAILGVLTVVFAPLTEELVFRGLLLRTFMRRMAFWPATILSTAIFALFHTYEVDTLVGAVTLALSVACIGLVNCVINRYTDRLTAGIGVHAASNLLALVVIVATAKD
jgi:membrane protease YdiL (CAAX protease family)